MKKILLILTITSLLFAMMMPLTTIGAENPTISLSFTDPDENGTFFAEIKMYNIEFDAAQIILSYNLKAVSPISLQTGEATTDFNEAREIMAEQYTADNGISKGWYDEYFGKINQDKGLINYVFVVSLSSQGPNDMINEKGNVVANADGLFISRIKFKKIGTENPNIKIPTTNDEVYEPSLPVGVMALKNTIEEIPLSITTLQNEKLNQPASAFNAQLYSDYKIQNPSSITKPTPSETEQNDPNIIRAMGSVFLNIENPTGVVDGYLMKIDKNNGQVFPYIQNERTFVPIRFISEAFKAQVTWNDTLKEVTIIKNDKTIKLKINSDTYTLNGETKTLDAKVHIKNDRTMVPIRLIAEALEMEVKWVPEDKIVVISELGKAFDFENSLDKKVFDNVKILFRINMFAG